MKSIWYFAGLLLTTLGIIITISAIYALIHPPVQQKVLAHLHPDLWWGIFMLIFGLCFALFNRRKLS
jgi:FtsH-binding integral membrane protein